MHPVGIVSVRVPVADAPVALAAGPDGAIWSTTAPLGIGRVAPEGRVEQYCLHKTCNAPPEGLIAVSQQPEYLQT